MRLRADAAALNASDLGSSRGARPVRFSMAASASSRAASSRFAASPKNVAGLRPVSYTHLTLPTTPYV